MLTSRSARVACGRRTALACAAALWFTISTGAALGANLPRPDASVRQYSLYFGDWSKSSARVGRAEARVQLNGSRYVIELIEHAEGLAKLFISGELRQTSTGTIGELGFAPQRYVEQRTGKPDRVIEFDERAGLVRLSRDQLSAPWISGIQDRLSVTYQLGLLMRERGGAAGAEFALSVAALSEVDPMHFTVRGEQTLTIGGKALRTIHLARAARDPRKDNQIDVWLMPDDAMLPARLRITDPSGRVLDQVLD